MANLPEKNITTVDKITSIPSNTNLYINANGEFRQATVDDVLKSSPVIADSIANQYKNASGSPILLTDSADGVAIDFDVYGRSTQDGEPTPTEPITLKSVGDMGYFDGELLGGYYNSGGVFIPGANTTNVGNINPIPCNGGDVVKIIYEESISAITTSFYDENMVFIERQYKLNTNEFVITAPSNAKYMNFHLSAEYIITPQTAKHICVTINDKYALIVDSVGKNLLDISKFSKISQENVTVKDNTITVASGNYVFGIKFGNEDVGLEVGKTYTFTAKSISGIQLGGYKLSYIDGTYDNVFMGTMGTATITKEVKDILFYISTPYTGTTDVVIGDMQIEENNKATDYEPYIHSRKYIPISAPLRGIGEVKDEASLSECKVTRKLWSDVFDGSNLKCHTVVSLNTVVRATCSLSQKGITYATKFCSHLPIVPDYNLDAEHCYTSDVSVHLFINKERLSSTDVEGVNEWLQANPITLIYELAEPTTESIEPIDVDTFEGVTHISVSDDADMEVEYPASKVAGIASIGWSKGRRAEYDLEQLKVQMLALQTTIVSTV